MLTQKRLERCQYSLLFTVTRQFSVFYPLPIELVVALAWISKTGIRH